MGRWEFRNGILYVFQNWMRRPGTFTDIAIKFHIFISQHVCELYPELDYGRIFSEKGDILIFHFKPFPLQNKSNYNLWEFSLRNSPSSYQKSSKCQQLTFGQRFTWTIEDLLQRVVDTQSAPSACILNYQIINSQFFPVKQWSSVLLFKMKKVVRLTIWLTVQVSLELKLWLKLYMRTSCHRKTEAEVSGLIKRNNKDWSLLSTSPALKRSKSRT